MCSWSLLSIEYALCSEVGGVESVVGEVYATEGGDEGGEGGENFAVLEGGRGVGEVDFVGAGV